MSAFLCTDKHISAIVSFASLSAMQAFGMDVRGNEQAVGQKFLDENYRSLNRRYRNEFGAPHTFAFANVKVDLVTFCKALHCLEYQSCESSDWDTTGAHDAITAMLLEVTRLLPGYEKAPWGIS